MVLVVAGSAAARARYTAAVLRERSVAFVFAPVPRAYRILWRSFVFMEAVRHSSGVGYLDVLDENG